MLPPQAHVRTAASKEFGNSADYVITPHLFRLFEPELLSYSWLDGPRRGQGALGSKSLVTSLHSMETAPNFEKIFPTFLCVEFHKLISTLFIPTPADKEFKLLRTRLLLGSKRCREGFSVVRVRLISGIKIVYWCDSSCWSKLPINILVVSRCGK